MRKFGIRVFPDLHPALQRSEPGPAISFQNGDILQHIYETPSDAVIACFLQNRIQFREPIREPVGSVDLPNATQSKFRESPRRVVAAIDSGGSRQGGEQRKLIAESEGQVAPIRTVAVV